MRDVLGPYVAVPREHVGYPAEGWVSADGPVSAACYDNHHPKGHHRHWRRAEDEYPFTTLARLLRDFLADVRRAKAARHAMEEPR